MKPLFRSNPNARFCESANGGTVRCRNPEGAFRVLIQTPNSSRQNPGDLAITDLIQPGIGSHPQSPLRVAGQRQDGIAGEPILSGEHAGFASIKAGQPGAQRAYPDHAARVLKHRPGIVTRQPFGGGERQRPAIHELVQPALGAHPEASFAILIQCSDGALRQTVLGEKTFDLAIAPAAETAIRADPNRSVPALGE